VEPEYLEPYRAWKAAPTPAAGSSLLRTLRPVLDAGVRSYAPDAGPLAAGWAKELALDAVRTYDPAAGGLRPHVLRHMQGLQRRAGRQRAVLRLPERWSIERARLDRARVELSDELLRDPTEDELSDRTGLPAARVRRLAGLGYGLTEGQASRPLGDGEGGPAAPAVDRPPPERQALEYVLPGLDPIDRELAVRRAGLRGDPEPLGHAARALNLTPSAASQRLARVQRLVDEVLARRAFGG
jgi:hypothetical protein